MKKELGAVFSEQYLVRQNCYKLECIRCHIDFSKLFP